MGGDSFEILRTQFPLRRAFSITTNKSQGQSIKQAIFDIRDKINVHGQAYVGLSRIERYDKMTLFINSNLRPYFQEIQLLPRNNNNIY